MSLILTTILTIFIILGMIIYNARKCLGGPKLESGLEGIFGLLTLFLLPLFVPLIIFKQYKLDQKKD